MTKEEECVRVWESVLVSCMYVCYVKVKTNTKRKQPATCLVCRNEILLDSSLALAIYGR
jgi:hypothetical protein